MFFGKEEYLDINFLINKKLSENKHLIASHRGSHTGNIIQNTIPAYIASFKMGADLVECDVNRTTDGVLYSFHDGYEDFLFHVKKSIKEMTSAEVEFFHPYNVIGFQNKNHINRLSDILDWLPEDKLLNIDRAWDIFPYLLEELDKHPKNINQVIIKSPVKGEYRGVRLVDAIACLQKHHIKYMYMPICDSLDDVKSILSLKDINTVGCEIIVNNQDSELLKEESIKFIHNNNLFIWINAITLGDYNHDSLSGYYDDDISVIDNEELGWGKLFEKKIDIIQTDWPSILYLYREKVKK